MTEDTNSQPTAGNPPVSTTDAQDVNPTAIFESPSSQKPSKWRYFFIALGILQIACLTILILFAAWAIHRYQGKPDIAGVELIDLIVLATLVPATGLIALSNFIGLPLYLRRHKPQGKWLVLSIISLSVSAIVVLWLLYTLLG